MKTLKYSLLLFFIITVNAQEVSTISGFVRDDASGEPLGYANVFIKDTNIGGATNMEGYFVISNVPAGAREIAVSIIGFEIHAGSSILNWLESERASI